MDQEAEANQLQFYANFGLEKMGPNNDQKAQLGDLSMEEEGLVAVSSDSASGESSSIDDDDDSMNSIGSSSASSSDLVEDASSPPSSGPLYELSELMAQLPIKRGLSKFYQGKSQSYTSLASVKCLGDLAKKGPNNFRNRLKMKSCKSYSGLEGHIRCFGPKATISKRSSSSSRGSFLSSSSSSNLGRRSGSFVGTMGIPSCPHRTNCSS